MSFKILAEAKSAQVSGYSNTSVLWLKSKSLKAIGPCALQLETKSNDATTNGHPDFWFEIAVFADSDDETPIRTWFSHMNESIPTIQNNVWHFGPVFYPDHDIFESLEVGNVVGVQIGSVLRSSWSLEVQGRLVMKPLIGLTDNLVWSLRDSPDEGVYTISTNDECSSISEGNTAVNEVWFTTPSLPDDAISRLNGIKLFTNAHHQGYISNPRQGIWSWFELAAFKDEDEDENPLIGYFNGAYGPLVAVSHEIAKDADSNQRQEGKLFGRGDDFVSNLKAGNAIGVRVCAQHRGWENHAVYGRLLFGFSERRAPPLPPNEAKLKDFTLQLLSMVMAYDKDVLKGVLKELEVAVLSKE